MSNVTRKQDCRDVVTAVLNLQQKAVAFTARQDSAFTNRELSDAALDFVCVVERIRTRRLDRKKKGGA